MALSKRIECSGFSYEEEIKQIGPEVIFEAKTLFEDYKKRGVIICGDFDSTAWRATNEVSKNLLIDFSINELQFRRSGEEKLGCTYSEFFNAIRVYAVLRMNFALTTVVADIRTLVHFAEDLCLPDDSRKWSAIRDFLEMLPRWSAFVGETLDTAYNPVWDLNSSAPRKLQSYRSYFAFDHYLHKFWDSASAEEKILYFPLWLWWRVTMVIPLRVTEFVLTPRNCISRGPGGKYIITLRRTRLKTESGSATHTINGDYEKCSYEIPENIYNEISQYIASTADSYDSDIDTLFCKNSQFSLGTVSIRSDRHYTYSNLHQLLTHFYDHVLFGRFGLVPGNGADDESLPEGAINMILLGDTRHIANINLMVSGNSVVMCKELSRHNSLQTGANYYGSVKSFLDALSLEFARPIHSKSAMISGKVGTLEELIPYNKDFIPVAAGRCASAKVASGDYSPCAEAVGPYGELGYCRACQFFSKRGTAVHDCEVQLKETCELLTDALASIQKEMNGIPLKSILTQLQAKATQYLTATAAERRFREEEQYGKG